MGMPAIGVVLAACMDLSATRWLASAVVVSLLCLLIADLFSPSRLLESHLRSNTNFQVTFAVRCLLRFLAVVTTFTALAIALGSSVTIETALDQSRRVFIGSVTGLGRGLTHTGSLATVEGQIRFAQVLAALAFYFTALRALRGILFRQRSIADQLAIARDQLLTGDYEGAETVLDEIVDGDRNGEWASLRAVLVLKQNQDLAGATRYLVAASQLAESRRASAWMQLFLHARTFDLKAAVLIQLVRDWSRLPPDQIDEGELAGAVRTQMMIDENFAIGVRQHVSELPTIARALVVVRLDPARASEAAGDLERASKRTSPLGVLVAWSVLPIAVRNSSGAKLVLTEEGLSAIETAANELPTHQAIFGLADVESVAMFAEIPPALAVRYGGVLSDLEARLPESERRLFERGRRQAAASKPDDREQTHT